jgi:hypothetical protein
MPTISSALILLYLHFDRIVWSGGIATYLLDVGLVPGQPVRLGHDRVPNLGQRQLVLQRVTTKNETMSFLERERGCNLTGQLGLTFELSLS